MPATARRDPAAVVWEGFVAIATQLGKLAGAVVAMWVVVAFLLRPWTEPFLALPESVANLAESNVEMKGQLTALQSRVGDLGEVPPRPFVEIAPGPRMWPDTVRPGQAVQVTYLVRRNRQCDTTVERRFQAVQAVAADPALTGRDPATVAPVTLGFEIFTVPLRIPIGITPGRYAYRPVLYCPGEPPVTPPPTFFEVTE